MLHKTFVSFHTLATLLLCHQIEPKDCVFNCENKLSLIHSLFRVISSAHIILLSIKASSHQYDCASSWCQKHIPRNGLRLTSTISITIDLRPFTKSSDTFQILGKPQKINASHGISFGTF